MVWAERPLQDDECVFEERLGISIATLDEVQRGQVVQRLGDGRVVGAEFPLRKNQSLFGNIRCFDVPTSQVELLYLPGERIRIIGALRLCSLTAR